LLTRIANGREPRNIPLTPAPAAQLQEPPNPDAETQSQLDLVFQLQNALNPHMRNYEARLQTFDRRWPRSKINASIEHIARAGFFFLGTFVKIFNMILKHTPQVLNAPRQFFPVLTDRTMLNGIGEVKCLFCSKKGSGWLM